ncbi:MAG: hypothetical protein N3G21_00860 [Candidatus Hydrogenedentes bacterium]|nr:hypothetical protein [Candidatus Hydrogenedentota bacterium]
MRWNKILSHSRFITVVGVFYVLGHSFCVLISELISNYLYQLKETSTIPTSLASLLFAMNDILFCAGIGALQAICFCRLGAKLDAPIWRCKSDKEALKRFFLIWFGVNVAIVTLTNLVGTFGEYGYSGVSDFLALFSILVLFVYLPLTICWMHSGEKAIEEEEIFKVFRPITRQLGDSVGMWIIIGVSILASLYVFSFEVFTHHNLNTSLLKAVVIIPFSVVDIIVFCWVWNLCIEYRNAGLDNEYDLDEF